MSKSGCFSPYHHFPPLFCFPLFSRDIPMSQTLRRSFLKGSTLATASAVVVSQAKQAQALTLQNQLRVGVIGLGGQGKSHLRGYLENPEVEVAWICDVDSQRLNEAKEMAGGTKATADLRQILNDSSVDFVSIATPDHWHTPAALLALQAGKHVYVEKPCSHNLREGRMLIEAARRSGKLVQHGTQSRSAVWIRQAMEALKEGIIGDVMIAKAWDVQFRPPIGHAEPTNPPDGLDYDAWVGPAEMVPYQTNRAHYSWHWWYNFGTGDAGNDGVHEIDIARWGLGVNTQPVRVAAVGGKYVHQDDQQFPDTMTAVFEYPNNAESPAKQLIFEMRLWSRYYPHNMDNANEFLGTKGRMLLTKRGKVQVFDEKGKEFEFKITADRSVSVMEHQKNFIKAIRGEAALNADVETAHLSSSLPHLANLACRLGRSFAFEPQSETIVNDPEANRMLTRIYRESHWGAAGVL